MTCLSVSVGKGASTETPWWSALSLLSSDYSIKASMSRDEGREGDAEVKCELWRRTTRVVGGVGGGNGKEGEP